MKKLVYFVLSFNFYWLVQTNSLPCDGMEHHALKNVNNCLYTNVYSYLETSGGISYNLYLNVVHFFNTRVN
jgi:hypothetical protein